MGWEGKKVDERVYGVDDCEGDWVVDGDERSWVSGGNCGKNGGNGSGRGCGGCGVVGGDE